MLTPDLNPAQIETFGVNEEESNEHEVEIILKYA
jgi:hypothetical protein